MGSYPSGANGRARVDARAPSAFGICDRCGFRYNLVDLSWQFDWRGDQLQNLRIRVCDRCHDVPQPQLRSYSPPPDPLPVRDPRPDMSNEGNAPGVLTTVAGSSQLLIAADPTRTLVNFTMPPSFGLWLNVTGGAASAAGPGCAFYGPGNYYEAFNAASQPAIHYFTTIAGLLLVVQSQSET